QRLQARAAARTLVADHDHVARLDDAALDGRRRVVFALEHAGTAAKREERGIDPGRLDDTALARQVAVQHGEAAVPAVGVLDVADAPRGAFEIERIVVRVLRAPA